jgi:hypothetical protein
MSASRVAARDLLEGLARIGLDEISYKQGPHYIMIVVDHDTGRLVWAAAGRDRKTLRSSSPPLVRPIALPSLTSPPTPSSGSQTRSR